MISKTKRLGIVAGVTLMLSGISVFRLAHPAYAAVAPIIINEIQYNSAGNNQDHEFLELYNTTAAPIDISGWCFTAGISLCFSSGTTIGAHGYGVISPNQIESLIIYQVHTIGTYSGNLSNSGETVTLRNASNQVINSVTYSDSGLWPVSADGNGSTLELKDPELDNSLPSSWGASTAAHTAGAVNSLVGASDPPTLSNFTPPTGVTDSESPLITVQAEDATQVTLRYKAQFNSDVTLTMHDDGLNGDVAASDDIYSATIPPHAAGTLVRYKIVASHGSASATIPNFNDTAMDYKGYVVQDPSITSNLPILRWYISDADYTDMITNHVFDKQEFNCVVAYGDEVYDRTKVRVKGEYSLQFPKNSLKFKLPKTSTINIPGETPRPLNEFHMNGEWIDQSKARSLTAWQIANEMGIITPAVFGTRLLKNNQFQGYYLFIEKYEKEFRDQKAYNGSWFEDYDELVSDAAQTSEMADLESNMLQPKSATRRQYVFDNINLPNFINFMAFQAAVGNQDWNKYNNIFSYKDSKGSNRTERWSLWPWDLDFIFASSDGRTTVSPYAMPTYISAEERFMATPLYDEPDIREMFFRRLRSYVDYLYSSDYFLTKYQANVALTADEAALDLAKWPTSSGDQTTNPQNWYEQSIAFQKKQLTVRYQLDRAIPQAQVAAPFINISEVNNSLVADEQFVKLTNPGTRAVDLSGWRLDELSFDIPAGSVIPAGGNAYVVRKDRVSKLTNPGRFVLGQLTTDLPTTGSVTLRRTDNSTAATVFYP